MRRLFSVGCYSQRKKRLAQLDPPPLCPEGCSHEASHAAKATNPLRYPRVLRTALVFVAFSCTASYKIIHGRKASWERIQRNRANGEPGEPSADYFSSVDDIDQNFEIVTTNFGWTTPGASRHSRRKISTEFFASVQRHPRYNSTAWEDLERHPDPSRRVVVFMDVDTCVENNYPTYGAPWTDNLDIQVEGEKFSHLLDKSCKYIRRAAESPALAAHRDSRLILLDCGDPPYYNIKDVCGVGSRRKKGEDHWGENLLDNTQVIIAYYGAKKSQVRPNDIGLPPPAIKPVALSPHERYYIETCERRDYLFSFQGRGGFRRDRLKVLDNGGDVYVRITDPKTYWADGAGEVDISGPRPNDLYDDIMRSSAFAGAPRGDCLWSYRFTEIASAGAVPVVIANDWLPPFSSPSDPDRVVDWTKCIVFVNENKQEVPNMINVLRNITPDVMCEMQRCSLAFWDAFASSRDGWLRGILRWVDGEQSRETGSGGQIGELG